MLKRFLTRSRLHPLHRRLQQDPHYRFISFEELQLAADWGLRIDANTASIDDWLRLPGLSIHQARRLAQLTAARTFFHCSEDVAAALSIPVQQAQRWEPVLQFCYYDAAYDLKPSLINVNTATLSELASIPAINSRLARTIVCSRQASRYQGLSDLQQRLQLSAHITAELLHYLSFE